MSKKKTIQPAKEVSATVTAPAESEPVVMGVDVAIEATPPKSMAEVKMAEDNEIRADFRVIITRIQEVKNEQEKIKTLMMQLAGKVNNL